MRQPLELAATPPQDAVELLPFQFHRWHDGTVLLTNLVGEALFVTADELERIVDKDIRDPMLLRRLRAKHIVRLAGEELPVELLALKYRTQHHRLADFTSLHMFVVTLRCEHTCRYCQVSRQNLARTEFDMTEQSARLAVEMAFRSPARQLKIEFQGGEPLLNMPRIRQIVETAKAMNLDGRRELSFVVASNLALLDDAVLDFAEEHAVSFSTSLDGPRDLHNRNRPRPGADSWERTLAGVERIRQRLGPDRVSALMTTTAASLPRAREIVDTYVEHGFRDIFLRPVSPYGHATRLARRIGYDTDAWITFYREGLAHILDLNARGIPVRETFAAIVLTKMLTNSDPGYVDLTSPAGIGIHALLYNYDGDVYASDEGRMLAEMGDKTFRLGNLSTDSYDDMMTSDALLDPLEQSFAFSAPMCTTCAFERFCGADPVFHHATDGDPVGRKPESAFCRRNLAVFETILDAYRSEPATRAILRSWATP